MADLGGQFNAEEVAPAGDRTPIPAGDYRCVIIKSEWKATSKGNGKYLEITFQIIEDGMVKGRMLWSRLNLQNPNSQAVEIARSELSSLCRSVGKMVVRDTAELHDIPLVVSVSLKKREDTGDITNEVKGYKSVAASAAAATTAAVAVGGQSKPSWM